MQLIIGIVLAVIGIFSPLLVVETAENLAGSGNKSNKSKTKSKPVVPSIVHDHTVPDGAKHDPKTLALLSIKDCHEICHCNDILHCNPNVKAEKKETVFNQTPSIVMVSNGSEMWRHWKWNRITAVMSEGPFSDTHKENWPLLCYAHSLTKRYGYVEKIKNEHQFDDYDKLTAYIKDDMNHLYCGFNSLIGLDFLELFENPGSNLTVEKFSYFLRTFRLTQHASLPREKLYCIVPWTPCVKNLDCDSLTLNLQLNCDYIVIAPHSYMYADSDCKAKPEVPMVKLAMGVDQYISRGVKSHQIIVGVPWHGYDHTCSTYDTKTATCKYSKESGKQPDTDRSFCSVTRRKYEALGELSLHNRLGFNPNVLWSDIYEAPYFTYTDPQNTTHQVWYENWRSLSRKYEFVRLFEMGGVSIWFGDDLRYNTSDAHVRMYSDSMWSYLVTGLYHHTTHTLCPDYAGKVAGAAIGCLLLGAFLGFLVMYIACVRRNHFDLRPPFRKDAQQFVDDPEI